MPRIDELLENAKVDTTKPSWRTRLSKPDAATFDPKRTYYAHMKTSKGPILVRFMPDVAPMHVTSFLYLSRLGVRSGPGPAAPGTSSRVSSAPTSSTIGPGSSRWRTRAPAPTAASSS
jgi:hypothetical protein